MTHLVFIGTSGRSGSYGLANALNLIDGVEAHHQYNCVAMQRIGTLYYHNVIGKYEAMAELDKIYGAALRYARCEQFVDVSNKLPWVMDLLQEMYPKASFVYVVRDGIKVCLSYYHKLPEVYHYLNRWPLINYLTGGHDAPPLEERYWWPYNPELSSRWEMLCWHWKASYEVCHCDSISFEYVVSGGFNGLLNKCLIPYADDAEEFLTSKPHNVIEPQNYVITAEQQQFFEEFCGQFYRELGYVEPYKVEYVDERL